MLRALLFFLFSLLFLTSQASIHWELTESALKVRDSFSDFVWMDIPRGENGWVLSHGKDKVKAQLGSFDYRYKVREEFYLEEIQAEVIGSCSLRAILSFRDDEQLIEGILLVEELQPGAVSARFYLVGDSPARRMHLRLRIPPGPVWGGGEQFSYLNLAGHTVRMSPEENGVGRGDPGITGITRLAGASGDAASTYLPIPFFMLGPQRALFLNHGTAFTVDWGERQPGMMDALILGTEWELLFWHAAHPLELLSALSEVQGTMPLLPEWAWGTWLGVQGGPEKVREVTAEAREAGNPVSAVWIQDWVGKRQTVYGSRLWWNWSANDMAYPDLKGLIADLRRQDIHTLAYLNPFLATDAPMLDSLRPYLLHDEEHLPYTLPAGGFDAHIIDLYRQGADTFLQRWIGRELIDLGFSGWMADFGEWYPYDPDIPRPPYTDWFQLHNAYPVRWQTINQQVVEAHPRAEELLFFSRSGYRGSPAQSMLFWTGDQLCGWGQHDGLPSAVRALITSGMSGISLNHTDIGGYTNVNLPFLKIHRDDELFYRWTEMAAFTPVFRTHEGLQPQHNVQPWTSTATQQFFARFGRLHLALKPYLMHLNEEAAQRGWPMVRQMALHFPEDSATWNLDAQYMLGADLLVAPVMEPGAATVEVYFPAGTWQHLLQDEEVQGPCRQTVAAPLGRPAVYLRAAGEWSARIREAVEREEASR